MTVNIGDHVRFTRNVDGMWNIKRGEIFEVIDEEPDAVWLDVHGRRGRLFTSSIVNSDVEINGVTYAVLIPSAPLPAIDVQTLL